jgi:succinate dehydrogenase/fumarate reductase-like Fe-S protein
MPKSYRGCDTDPTCSECRAAGDLRDHDSCTGCIGCGCATSACFAVWANKTDLSLIQKL